MTRLIAACMFALILSACSGQPKDHIALQGEWAPQTAELGGQPFPLSTFQGATLKLTKDTYEFFGDQGSYTLLPKTTPAAMDITGQQGPNAGRTIQAIYRIKRDDLTVCYQLGAAERPAEFAAPKGSQIFLVTYKRVR